MTAQVRVSAVPDVKLGNVVLTQRQFYVGLVGVRQFVEHSSTVTEAQCRYAALRFLRDTPSIDPMHRELRDRLLRAVEHAQIAPEHQGEVYPFIQALMQQDSNDPRAADAMFAPDPLER